MIYKYSKYNHHGLLHNGSILIYNVLSSSVALLNQEEFDFINHSNIFYNSNPDLCSVAAEQGFIVPKNEDETAKLLALRNTNNFNDKRAGFQILPTTACNARCFYCYEQDFETSTMDQTTIDATVSFILDFCENMDEVTIVWFGGEPLTCEKTIAEISKCMIPALEGKGKHYNANMITNGSLITEDNIEAIVNDYHITSVQITLDGRGQEHLKRKKFTDNSITYERILSNIALLTQHDVNVMVRINADKNNISDCLNAITDLSKINAKFENLWPYVAPLYSDGANKTSCLAKEELNNVFELTYKRLIDCGFIQTIDGLPMNFSNATCCAKILNNYVISPNGDISKCEHLLNVPSEVIGSVFEGITFNEAMAKWSDSHIPSSCQECSFLPICQAGCSAAEQRGFGYGRCSYIAFIHDAVIAAADYLIEERRLIS